MSSSVGFNNDHDREYGHDHDSPILSSSPSVSVSPFHSSPVLSPRQSESDIDKAVSLLTSIANNNNDQNNTDENDSSTFIQTSQSHVLPVAAAATNIIRPRDNRRKSFSTSLSPTHSRFPHFHPDKVEEEDGPFPTNLRPTPNDHHQMRSFGDDSYSSLNSSLNYNIYDHRPSYQHQNNSQSHSHSQSHFSSSTHGTQQKRKSTFNTDSNTMGINLPVSSHDRRKSVPTGKINYRENLTSAPTTRVNQQHHYSTVTNNLNTNSSPLTKEVNYSQNISTPSSSSGLTNVPSYPPRGGPDNTGKNAVDDWVNHGTKRYQPHYVSGTDENDNEAILSSNTNINNQFGFPPRTNDSLFINVIDPLDNSQPLNHNSTNKTSKTKSKTKSYFKSTNNDYSYNTESSSDDIINHGFGVFDNRSINSHGSSSIENINLDFQDNDNESISSSSTSSSSGSSLDDVCFPVETTEDNNGGINAWPDLEVLNQFAEEERLELEMLLKKREKELLIMNNLNNQSNNATASTSQLRNNYLSGSLSSSHNSIFENEVVKFKQPLITPNALRNQKKVNETEIMNKPHRYLPWDKHHHNHKNTNINNGNDNNHNAGEHNTNNNRHARRSNSNMKKFKKHDDISKIINGIPGVYDEKSFIQYRFTYFREDLNSTIHSPTISGLLQPGQTFANLFSPEQLLQQQQAQQAQQPNQPNQQGNGQPNRTQISVPNPSIQPQTPILNNGNNDISNLDPLTNNGKTTPILNNSNSNSNGNEIGGSQHHLTPKQSQSRPQSRSQSRPQSQSQSRPQSQSASISPSFNEAQESIDPIPFWLDVLNPTEEEMKTLSKSFGIHPLTTEDIFLRETREKVELFKNYYFICFRSFDISQERKKRERKQAKLEKKFQDEKKRRSFFNNSYNFNNNSNNNNGVINETSNLLNDGGFNGTSFENSNLENNENFNGNSGKPTFKNISNIFRRRSSRSKSFSSSSSMRSKKTKKSQSTNKHQKNKHNSRSRDIELEPLNMYVIVFREGVITFHFAPTPHPINVRRRARLLRDYLKVSSDWICYALIDDITDGFAPMITSLEDEVNNIEDTILRLHSGDVSESDSDSDSNYGNDYDNDTSYRDDKSCISTRSKTSLGISSTKSTSSSSTSSSRSSIIWKRKGDMLRRIGECRKRVLSVFKLLNGKPDVIKSFAKRCNEHWEVAPRSEIGMYLGDIQDHVVTMVQALNHYEKLLARSHSNYLAQINIDMTRVNNNLNDVLGKISIMGSIVLPMNIVTGLWGMNVLVPGQESPGLAWFFSITLSLIFGAIGLYYVINRAYGF